MSTGLVYLTSGSLAADASQLVFDDVFSATYQSYLIMGRFTTTSNQGVLARLRSGGVDNTTASSYRNQYYIGNGATVAAVRLESDRWDFFSVNTAGANGFRTVITNPFTAKPTFFYTENQRSDSDIYLIDYGSNHSASTSFDGIKIYTTGNHLTGTIRIYGFRNS